MVYLYQKTMNYKDQQLLTLYQQHTQNPQSPLIVDNNTNIVFGEGHSDAILMLVGEAPGKDEDLQGRPFVGRAGKLLDKTFLACNLARKELYITNIVKTRPHNNRTPQEHEIQRCWPILEKQIEIIKPRVICTLGASATTAFLKTHIGISKIHGLAIPYNNTILIPLYHPAYVLRDPRRYEDFLSDMLFVAKTTKNIQK
jgi:uracil-DNA glycosylase